jgi:hypothetical protein
MAKKKKRSAEQMLKQVQDSLQVMPYYIEQQRNEGKWFRAFMLRYISAPVLRLMNRALGSRRYKGPEGAKLKQTDQMRRHLQQKNAARKQLQEMMRDNDPGEVMRQVSEMRKKAGAAKKGKTGSDAKKATKSSSAKGDGKKPS